MDSLEIIVSIRKIVRSLNLESKGIQKDFGLSIAQLLCMGHLQKAHNFQSTLKELMELLSLNSSTISGIINRLEKRGYVARLPKAGDKRVTFVVLTAAGLKLLQETPNVLHDRLADKLDTLSNENKLMVKRSLEIITSAMQIKQLDAGAVLSPEEPIN
ncbi:MarR family transcriptional regulator [Reichenbachiella agarivorans]|uniref:MarR family transcriptional regulator n=1 Tax=Reichenbachiella agarivorans TaxID=2979464 RepID=A0ABY6CME9_9BACT|nr:MarR family transcriptional regulator [Reichenbachiella agarivorans]UXP31700.1 MarR family transcriptional regulator [Reichenbachiella agarivorans]